MAGSRFVKVWTVRNADNKIVGYLYTPSPWPHDREVERISHQDAERAATDRWGPDARLAGFVRAVEAVKPQADTSLLKSL